MESYEYQILASKRKNKLIMLLMSSSLGTLFFGYVGLYFRGSHSAVDEIVYGGLNLVAGACLIFVVFSIYMLREYRKRYSDAFIRVEQGNIDSVDSFLRHYKSVFGQYVLKG